MLPWHESVEPCVSFLSTHSSSWEVRGPRGSWQTGVAVLALPQPGPVLGKQGPSGGSLALCPRRWERWGAPVLAMSVSWWPHARCGCALPGPGGCWWGWDEGNGAAAAAAGGAWGVGSSAGLLMAASQ